MREILFKAISERTKRFVCGSYFNADTGHTIIENGGSDASDFHFIDPKTVGQFTGLTDIDDIKAFEGDEVEVFFKGEWVYNAIIERDVCNPCFVLHYKYEGNGHDRYEYDFTACGLRTFKVIGNIHNKN